MNLFGWRLTIPEHWRRSRCPPLRPVAGKLQCTDCGGGIHRHDKYEILVARHRDCKDPKLVGQRVLPLDFENRSEAQVRVSQPVLREFAGETVLMAPACSMGAELLDGEKL